MQHKRIYDWQRHCYITVVTHDANHIGCYQSTPYRMRRGPMTLRQRIHRYLARYGPRTAKHLAKSLLRSTEQRDIARILWQLHTDSRFIVAGYVAKTGGRRKLWGVMSAKKTNAARGSALSEVQADVVGREG